MLAKLFGRQRTSPVLGVDISSNAVKVLALGREDGNIVVNAYGVSTLPPNAVADKHIADVGGVADTLRAACLKSRSKVKAAAIAVSGASVISKLIDMPADLSEDDMETQIGLEADQYIPYPLDEVALDFDIQGLSEHSPDQVEVLVAACRRESVDERVEVLELAELTPKIVDVEAYALERSFQRLAPIYGCDDTSMVAIIDIGATMTTLSVLEGGETVYTREQHFGGQALTEEIQRRYGLSADEAEQSKRRGGLPEDYEEEVLAPFREDLVQQISRSLQFFFGASHYSEDQVSLILLAGGVAVIPELAQLVGTEIGIKTAVANPFDGMLVASSVDREALAKDAPAMMIACGLALRSFD